MARMVPGPAVVVERCGTAPQSMTGRDMMNHLIAGERNPKVLAQLARPPFYAARIVPGDLGTKGGLCTDEHARVLRADGTPIEGLFAAGNASAAVMGHSYAGAGATIGPAMTFGYIAVHAMAETTATPGKTRT